MGDWISPLAEIENGDLVHKLVKSKENQVFEGCYLIPNRTTQDSRGFFRKVLPFGIERKTLQFPVCQVNISNNTLAGTVRGLHFQTAPFLESKLVTCIKGSVIDVLLDLRPQSKTFLKLSFFFLNSNSDSLLVPPQVAHGFQTLENDTTLMYLHSYDYNLEFSKGINPLDPKLGITWPLPIRAISESDSSLPLISEIDK